MARFYIIDQDSNVTKTDDAERAVKLSEHEDGYIVIDTEDGKVLGYSPGQMGTITEDTTDLDD